MNLSIYCDAKHEGLWFRNLSRSLSLAKFHKIGKRGTNPKIIEKLIHYDRPDIILTSGDIPVLVLEKTSEVPSGHNVGQRLGRMVRALEHEIAAIMFMPFDAKKHGKYAALCNLNARVLDCYLKMWTIHETPALAVNWPCDNNHELVIDGSEDSAISSVVDCFINSGFKHDCTFFTEHKKIMENEYLERVKTKNSYQKPPPSVKIVSTNKLVEKIQERTDYTNNIPHDWFSRKESVLYKIEMNEQKCRREDPYTGMQFLYDYQHCRNGKKPENKYRNLVIDIPKVSLSKWLESNPNCDDRKSVMWYSTANALLLKDGIITLR